MKQLRFKISNYHAIRQADIVLDGITVLTGPNGCGKSTLSRWLYYYLYCGINFELHVLSDLKYFISSIVRMLDGALTEKASDNWSKTSYNARTILKQNNLAFDEYDELCRNLILAFRKELMMVTSPQARLWCVNFSPLSKGYEDLTLQGRIKTSSRWSTKCYAIAEWLLDKYKSKKESLVSQLRDKKIATLNGKIKNCFDEYETPPSSVELLYSGQPLIKDGSFNIPADIEQVVYVDSPFAATTRTFDKIWSRFQSLLIAGPVELGSQGQVCSRLIRNVVNGVAMTRKDEVVDSKFLVFHTNEGQDFRLEKVATGIKTFAYIQRLIDTGNISENSLLLIDEPEAHLHPQWIVELANVIVKLHKLLGTKIMIASHNPDMVAAIQAISAREKLENATKFYLAQSEEETPGLFTFRDLGMDIAPIFDSFNIAIDRIDSYGVAK